MSPLNIQTTVTGIPIPQGQNFVVVSGLGLPFIPLAARASTMSGPGGTPIAATADTTTLSADGGTFNLSGAPVDGNQTLTATFYGYDNVISSGPGRHEVKVIVPVPQGSNQVVVAGLSLPFSPTDAWCALEGGPSAEPIFGVVDRSTITTDGATFNLSGAPTDSETSLIATFYGYTVGNPVPIVPGSLGGGFPLLYERAGKVAVGDFIGGKYVFDFDIQIDRLGLTCLAPAATTVLDLVIGGQLTGWQMVIPSGVPNTELSLFKVFNPPVAVVTNPAYGLTPTIRWQCLSGAGAIEDTISQVDLVAWAERLGAFPPHVVPFDGGSLVSPALSEGNVEAAAQTLFAEWLGDYFDGNAHPIGLNNAMVNFPAALIRFEQGEIQQPLNQIDATPPNPAQTEIRLTVSRRQERRDVAPQGWLMTAPANMSFWVRCKKQGRGQGPFLAREMAELLYSILNNPENRLALAEKGIKHLEPRGAVTIPSKDWSEMLVSCSGELQWYVYFNANGE